MSELSVIPTKTVTAIEDALKTKLVIDEPILEDNPDRFVLFPIEHNDIWQLYKKQQSLFWRAEEVDLAQDKSDWSKMSED